MKLQQNPQTIATPPIKFYRRSRGTGSLLEVEAIFVNDQGVNSQLRQMRRSILELWKHNP